MRTMKWRTRLIVLGAIAVFANSGAGKIALKTGTSSQYGTENPTSCGWEFSPTQDIVVTDLGLYLPANLGGGVGFAEAHPIAIWDGTTTVVLGTIPDGGGAGGGYVFIDTPDVTLSAGSTYVIAAYFVLDPWINMYTVGWGADPLISVSQTGVRKYPSSGLEIPTTVSSYMASPNFKFEKVTNQSPVADDDAAETTVNTQVVINVLDGDSDPDEDVIFVESVTSPMEGTATDNGDGTITYTPNADFVGTDSFEYTISDDYGGEATATVTVTVAPSDPAAMIVDLVAMVESCNLQNGIDNSLDAKLDAALNALDDTNENNDVAAINAMEAFISATQAQSGKKIPEADANQLIADAQAIIALLTAP